MSEDPDKQEEKFEFTAEGEALGYISLAQARLLAMQTARETPGEYGDRFSGDSMVFAIVESGADEDYYNVVLEIKPSGRFAGTPGREQFFISKEGEVALRQVLDPPRTRSRRPLLIVTAGIAVVIVAVAIGASSFFGSGPFGANPPLPPTTVPQLAAIPNATSTPNPTPVPTPTEVPVVVISSTGEPVPPDTPISTSIIPTFATPTVGPTDRVLLLSLAGDVIANANPARTAIDTIKFTLISAAEAQGVVDLSPIGVVVSYLDDDQAVNCFPPGTPSFSSGAPSCSWSTTWLIGSGEVMDPGEQVDMKVDLVALVPRLGERKRFTIQVKTTVGRVVDIKRTTPPELKATMALVVQSVAEEPNLRITGDVIADANAAKTSIDTIKLTLTSSDPIDLSTTGVVVTYLDAEQAIFCMNPKSFDSDVDTSECSWSTAWVIGSGDLVDPGEQVDMTVTLINLSPLLGKNKEFTIQVKPNKGAVDIVNRVTPAEIKAIMSLN